MVLRTISAVLIIMSTIAGLAWPMGEVQADLPPRGQPPNSSPDQPQPQKTNNEDSDSGPLGTHI